MRRVRVEFVDVESGQTVERATLPMERVPNPLELKPQLRLGAQRWVVIRAEPAASDEVTASGRLRLTVRRVEELTTAELSFDAPSLAPFLPQLGPSGLEELLSEEFAGELEEEVVIPRGDWRQLELVSRSHAERLAKDLQAVRRVVRTEGPGGFSEVHVRAELVPSATPPIGLEWLYELIRSASLHPLRLDGLQTVRAGFAIRGGSGLTFYGVAPRARVEVLGLALPPRALEQHALYHDLAALSELGEVHGLVLLDWRRARAYPPERFPEALL